MRLIRLRHPSPVLAGLALAALALGACSSGTNPPSRDAAAPPTPSASATRNDSAGTTAPTATPVTTPSVPPVQVVQGTKFVKDPVVQARIAAERAARAAAAQNPLAGRAWGVFKGPEDQAWPPYAASSGETRDLLASIALRPKAKWFGDWISDGDIAAKVSDYIANSQAGDPDALVQMTMFRMVPWEHEACGRLPSAAEQASYKRWTDSFASAIGDTPTAVILQPDGPFALCVPGRSPVPSSLIAYSARVLGELPNTSVYIDAGAADWPAEGQGGVDAALDFLVPAGVEYVRGFALNSTHYSSTTDEVARGAAIAEALAARGITDKHFVVNTSSNGRPFTFGSYRGPDPDNANVCRSVEDQACVTLGIPPTAEVADPAWGLSAETNALAATYADGYLWFGRPWLYRQNDPFDLQRALQLVRTTPY